jgi:hypothetical protein
VSKGLSLTKLLGLWQDRLRSWYIFLLFLLPSFLSLVFLCKADKRILVCMTALPATHHRRLFQPASPQPDFNKILHLCLPPSRALSPKTRLPRIHGSPPSSTKQRKLKSISLPLSATSTRPRSSSNFFHNFRRPFERARKRDARRPKDVVEAGLRLTSSFSPSTVFVMGEKFGGSAGSKMEAEPNELSCRKHSFVAHLRWFAQSEEQMR